MSGFIFNQMNTYTIFIKKDSFHVMSKEMNVSYYISYDMKRHLILLKYNQLLN